MDQESRFIELETHLAFQNHTIDELNKVVISLAQELTQAQLRIGKLESQLKDYSPSYIKSISEEEPPPHY